MTAPVSVASTNITPPAQGLRGSIPVAPATPAGVPLTAHDTFTPCEQQSSLPRIAPAAASASPSSPTQASMGAVRTALATLDFPPLDPFAASVAAVVWSSTFAVLTGKTEHIEVEGAMRKPLAVEVNLKHGKDAPMLLILPGLGASTAQSQVRALKSQALDHGMNYTVIPNPWSSDWLDAEPLHAPGNLPWETQTTRAVLHQLQDRHPGYYDKVSAVGYSYGALLGASVVAHDTDPDPHGRTVQGSLVAVSPPATLLDSMQALDHLRDEYDPPTDLKRAVALYGASVGIYGYEKIMRSPIAQRHDTDAEKYLADRFASRDYLEDVMRRYDEISGTNQLPYHHALAAHGLVYDARQSDLLLSKQSEALEQATFGQYVDRYLVPDLKTTNPDTTAEQESHEYSYTNLLAKAMGHGVPILTLSAADDYILQPSDVAEFRTLESTPAPDQAARVLDHGGHVGVLFNPQLREQMYAFLATPPTPSTP